MGHAEEFDLSQFLTDSLSLQINATAPTRHMYPLTPKDRYGEFTKQDPLDVLGERSFGHPQEISEDTVGTPIQEFFRGVNVLVTGGTGFLGKILTEKLVRSVPHLGHVYLLIRSKRGKTSQERFDQLLEDRVFSRMKTEMPHYHTKISVVDGDISEPDLGLSEAARQMLCDRVHVVFHSAADVRFTEPLRVSIESNVLGSKRVLELAKKMKLLKSYVHVSTAYSHCVRRVIEETVYKLNFNYKELLKYIESKTDEELLQETPRILQGWPNSYTFSKAVCEDMIEEEAEGLPLCIFRPSVGKFCFLILVSLFDLGGYPSQFGVRSIADTDNYGHIIKAGNCGQQGLLLPDKGFTVCATYREPVRGWSDNLYGPVALFLGAAHGVIHCVRIDLELSLDIVPVDYVVNCMIAVASRTETHRDSNVLPVFNFSSTPVKPMCWKEPINCGMKYKGAWPNDNAIWYVSCIFTTSYWLSEFCYYVLHRGPGILFDKLAELTGGKPRLGKIYMKVNSLKEQTNFFLSRIWEFKNENVMSLWKNLNEKDKLLFHFDLRDVDTQEHFLVSKLGNKYYYLKEKLEDLPAALRRNKWLYWLHISLKTVCGVAALKVMVVLARALPL